MKSMVFGVALIIAGLGGLVFAQTGGNLPAPDNFVPPGPEGTPPPPPISTPPVSTPPPANGAAPANQPPSAQVPPVAPPAAGAPSTTPPTPGAAAPGSMTPPPRDQGLKVDGSAETIPPEPESGFRVFRIPKPFDFEHSTSYDETVKRDIFYFRGISDLYRKADPTGAQETEGSKDRLTQYDLDSFEVLGIMWDVSKPKAIIRDPLGGFHNLVKGVKIGVNNGTVVGIREGEVIVMEYTEEEDRVVKKPRVMVIKNKAK